ncbi:MAG: undecaprenyl-diphosphate phosphatase [Oscillospiraceae bacterium]|nr:undecaprenyl-diphosphate phosphatase [Oscillospiraceae bacterium]
MLWLKALFLGLLQGVAEFLPISSSGHLAVFRHVFGLKTDELGVFFDVMLHVATLTAVIAVFHKDVLQICKAFGRLFTAKSRESLGKDLSARLLLLCAVGSLPLLAAALLHGYVEKLFDSLLFVGFAFLATGVVLKLSARFQTGKKTAKSAKVSDALIVGCIQAVAVVPGLSRSGVTITAGFARGLSRDFAVKFSFLLSIPAVLGAAAIEIVKVFREGVPEGVLGPTLAAMAVAGVAGFFAISLIRRLVANGSFSAFSWYCLCAGAVTLILSLV